MYYVYRFVDKKKNIIYVGKSKQELEQRREYAQPVMSAESYTKTFRKLG